MHERYSSRTRDKNEETKRSGTENSGTSQIMMRPWLLQLYLDIYKLEDKIALGLVLILCFTSKNVPLLGN
jgi:hypothetical protein